ncbi:MAG: hypothetical protein JWO07_611 [Candidatus Saccharibacteria bacterium]|nr:hypothetical protein [Candidatus Saccharibacteria bacterium]
MFNFQMKQLTKRQRAIVLPVMVAIGTTVVVLAILTIVVFPTITRNAQRGVAANGFSAYLEKGTDLGAGKIVQKSDVVAALGNKAKSVSDVDVSGVFNYNGDRGQTATYNFVRSDGVKASLYIDMTAFKSTQSMDDQQILAETGLAQIINGHSAYYMHAQTIGGSREYRLVVINDIKAYKFVIDQPLENIKINEVSAVASLIKLAQKAAL